AGGPPAPAFPPGPEARRGPAAASAAAIARLRVPLIAEGADPGNALHPSCEVVRVLSLDVGALGPPEALVRPFAYVLGASFARRAPDLGAGGIAVLSRARIPLEPRRVFAVRADEGVELSRVLWNGRAILMLPASGRSDFAVLEAPDEDAMRARIVGHVARVLDPGRLT